MIRYFKNSQDLFEKLSIISEYNSKQIREFNILAFEFYKKEKLSYYDRTFEIDKYF